MQTNVVRMVLDNRWLSLLVGLLLESVSGMYLDQSVDRSIALGVWLGDCHHDQWLIAAML
jgi:hypothetical protein